VDPGNIVQATDTNGLVVITQLDPISVIFTTPRISFRPSREDARRAAIDGGGVGSRELKNKLADGKLETIDNQIDPTTGTLKLRAVFANETASCIPANS
jgi:multidrug efflux system membrane fusion protein